MKPKTTSLPSNASATGAKSSPKVGKSSAGTKANKRVSQVVKVPTASQAFKHLPHNGILSYMTMDKTGKSYHKLVVWQKCRELLLLTYKLTEKLPRSEEFGLKSQMRRAIVSVISNFVEGYLKKSAKEKLRYMEIAETSLLELEAQSEICQMLEYWNDEESTIFDKKRGETGYLLFRYKSKISF